MEEFPLEAEVWNSYNHRLAELHQEMDKESKNNTPRNRDTLSQYVESYPEMEFKNTTSRYSLFELYYTQEIELFRLNPEFKTNTLETDLARLRSLGSCPEVKINTLKRNFTTLETLNRHQETKETPNFTALETLNRHQKPPSLTTPETLNVDKETPSILNCKPHSTNKKIYLLGVSTCLCVIGLLGLFYYLGTLHVS